MRKFFSVRTEIFRLPHGVIFPYGRRHFSLRKTPFFPAEGGEFSQVGKFVFQAWKIFFPRQESFPSFEGKQIALEKKKDRPSEEKRLPS